MTATSEKTSTPGPTRTEIVDVDVHERAALEELVPYLEPQWRRYSQTYVAELFPTRVRGTGFGLGVASGRSSRSAPERSTRSGAGRSSGRG